MADTVEFELVSPSRLLTSRAGGHGCGARVPRVTSACCPSHSPLICTVRPGVIKVSEGDKVTEQIFVAGGFCEVSPDPLHRACPKRPCTLVADIDASVKQA